MSVPIRRRAGRTTSWALVLTALLLVAGVGVGTTYLTLPGLAGCVAAMVAAAGSSGASDSPTGTLRP